MLFGPEGIGKTTFAAGAPTPIFLGAEDGTGQLDVARFPQPRTFDDALEALRTLYSEKHDYKTLVIDTLDWLEPLIWDHCTARDSMKSIEDYGYGKGYQVALDEWRRLIVGLERVRREKGLEVVLLGHAALRTFKNPEGPDFDRYELKVHQKAAGLLKEWCDAVLFANWETFATKRDGDKKGLFAKGKGVSSGARLMWTWRTAAFDAKNRFSLPTTLPLGWADYEAACLAGQVSAPEDLIAACTAKAAELGPEVAKQVAASLEKAGRDTQKLSQLNNWLNAKLAAKAEKEG